jgi:hypothetical protein
MVGSTALPLIFGITVFVAVRVPAVRLWLEGLSLARRARAIVSGRESTRLREARLALDTTTLTTTAAESDIAAWLGVAGSFYRSLSMFLLIFGLLSSSVYYMVFVVVPPLAQSRGWSFDEYYVFASAVTGLLVLVLLCGAATLAVIYLRRGRRSRSAPGNLYADDLVLTHRDDPASSLDAARHPMLASLIEAGRHV